MCKQPHGRRHDVFTHFARLARKAGLSVAVALSVASGAARADVVQSFSFNGALATADYGGTSVTGTFALDFTNNSVVSASFATPIGSFDVPSPYGNYVGNFISTGGDRIIYFSFYSSTGALILVDQATSGPVPALTFTPDLIDGPNLTYIQSGLSCTTDACDHEGKPDTIFFSRGALKAGAVTGIPELSTWTMLLLGFASLGFVGYRRTRPRLSAGRA